MTKAHGKTKGKMGSIEVFDYQQMKWVPYIPGSPKTNQYQNNSGTMAQQLRDTQQKLKEAEDKLKRLNERPPTVKQITQVAGAIERAKSEEMRRQKRMGQSSIEDWSKLKY